MIKEEGTENERERERKLKALGQHKMLNLFGKIRNVSFLKVKGYAMFYMDIWYHIVQFV